LSAGHAGDSGAFAGLFSTLRRVFFENEAAAFDLSGVIFGGF